jgi:peroxiredoxin
MTEQPRRRSQRSAARRSTSPNPWLILLGIFLIVGIPGIVLALIAQNQPDVGVTTTVAPPETGPQPGAQPPNFRLPGLNQEDRELSEYTGRPVMLFFWDSDCQPCGDVLRRLKPVADAQGDDLVVLLINTAFQDNQEAASSFVQPYGFTAPKYYILRDSTGSATRTQYQVKALPTSYFIKRDGTVSEAFTGPLPDDVLTAALAKIR